MSKQIDVDAELKRQGKSDPHWHFENDPRVAPEMKPMLDKLDKADIPWSFGREASF